MQECAPMLAGCLLSSPLSLTQNPEGLTLDPWDSLCCLIFGCSQRLKRIHHSLHLQGQSSLPLLPIMFKPFDREPNHYNLFTQTSESTHETKSTQRSSLYTHTKRDSCPSHSDAEKGHPSFHMPKCHVTKAAAREKKIFTHLPKLILIPPSSENGTRFCPGDFHIETQRAAFPRYTPICK